MSLALANLIGDEDQSKRDIVFHYFNTHYRYNYYLFLRDLLIVPLEAAPITLSKRLYLSIHMEKYASTFFVTVVELKENLTETFERLLIQT